MPLKRNLALDPQSVLEGLTRFLHPGGYLEVHGTELETGEGDLFELRGAEFHPYSYVNTTFEELAGGDSALGPFARCDSQGKFRAWWVYPGLRPPDHNQRVYASDDLGTVCGTTIVWAPARARLPVQH